MQQILITTFLKRLHVDLEVKLAKHSFHDPEAKAHTSLFLLFINSFTPARNVVYFMEKKL